MGLFDGFRAELRNKSAQRNRERMAYKEEYNKNRVDLQRKKAKLDAAESLGLNKRGTAKLAPKKKKSAFTNTGLSDSLFGSKPTTKKKSDPYPNIKTDTGFTYGGFK